MERKKQEKKMGLKAEMGFWREAKWRFSAQLRDKKVNIMLRWKKKRGVMLNSVPPEKRAYVQSL